VECFGKEVVVSREARAMGLRLGVACVEVLQLPRAGEEYSRRLSEELSRLREAAVSGGLSLESLKDHPVAKAYRSFYWRIGIDPTKTRPAGEALARRLLSGRGLASINPVVDAGNLASAETLVPIGLYDAAKAPCGFALTTSAGSEVFFPIGGGEKKLDKGVPVLMSCDVVVHLFPHRDSRLTCIDWESRLVVGVSAGVPGVSDSVLLRALERYLHYMERLGVSYRLHQQPSVVG